MVPSYKDMLEMQFDLQYYLHMSIDDFDNNDVGDNRWLHSRLVKQKQDENESRNKSNG